MPRLPSSEGVDPSADRQEKKSASDVAIADEARTFGAIARDWISKQKIAEITANKNRRIIETFLLPDLGDCPIHESRRASCSARSAKSRWRASWRWEACTCKGRPGLRDRNACLPPSRRHGQARRLPRRRPHARDSGGCHRRRPVHRRRPRRRARYQSAPAASPSARAPRASVAQRGRRRRQREDPGINRPDTLWISRMDSVHRQHLIDALWTISEHFMISRE